MKLEMAHAAATTPAGVDPVELHQPPALDRAAHLQPEVGEPHQDHQGEQDHRGDDDRAQVDPVEGCARQT